MLSQRRKTAGFTLMELLIVVIIIGLLATLALPQFPKAMERTRQAEARAQLGQIYQAERIYYAENNTYVAAVPGANPLVASIPLTASGENYFTYLVTSSSSTAFTATATRKISGGKTPAWTTAYTMTLDQSGDFAGGNI